MQASLCIWGNSNTNRKGRNIGAGNRLKEYNGTEYTHDPLGNLIYRELPNGEKQYFQYDTENQLTRAEIKKPQGNTEIWEYAYDPFGRRLSKERKDKLAWVSTDPKRTHFVWDGSRLLQEYTYKGNYTYIYTDQDSYEPLAQVFYNRKDDKQYLSYYHTDQIGIPREMTDQFGNLLWFGEYTAWGCLKDEKRIYQNAHQPFRLQNQYFDSETGLHYNFFRYYEPDTGRFVNQDPIGLLGGSNLYFFAPNAQKAIDPLGLWYWNKIVGTAQKTGTTGHKLVSTVYAHLYAMNPKVKRVTLDLGYKKLLGGGNFRWGPRPDVGVLYKDGSVRAIEVASKTDKCSTLKARNDNFQRGQIKRKPTKVSMIAVRLHKLLGRK